MQNITKAKLPETEFDRLALTNLQRKCVVWLYRNGTDIPYHAVRNKIISEDSYRKWTAHKIKEWLEVYKSCTPPTEEELCLDTKIELSKLVPISIDIISSCLISDEKVEKERILTARWLIDKLIFKTKGTTSQNAGSAHTKTLRAVENDDEDSDSIAELTNMLMLVKK